MPKVPSTSLIKASRSSHGSEARRPDKIPGVPQSRYHQWSQVSSQWIGANLQTRLELFKQHPEWQLLLLQAILTALADEELSGIAQFFIALHSLAPCDGSDCHENCIAGPWQKRVFSKLMNRQYKMHKIGMSLFHELIEHAVQVPENDLSDYWKHLCDLLKRTDDRNKLQLYLSLSASQRELLYVANQEAMFDVWKGIEESQKKWGLVTNKNTGLMVATPYLISRLPGPDSKKHCSNTRSDGCSPPLPGIGRLLKAGLEWAGVSVEETVQSMYGMHRKLNTRSAFAFQPGDVITEWPKCKHITCSSCSWIGRCPVSSCMEEPTTPQIKAEEEGVPEGLLQWMQRFESVNSDLVM
ncbi:hypothetical protein BU23DRAFT_574416 [Bimuria novae-zelandiae CBS 107.79]|uniref:Uncharacterized protein n=1 Tax=Bimuria novae-zelandiae CBS 107.79 TaxID=1447943 RepID=A0A6A5UQL9_9PLEO|nr:hypothetical protein BU23DRAFT_574416 [Bimuria novae-zelandiae CBS 107.79]